MLRPPPARAPTAPVHWYRTRAPLRFAARRSAPKPKRCPSRRWARVRGQKLPRPAGHCGQPVLAVPVVFGTGSECSKTTLAPAEPAPAQSARFVLCNQLLDFLPAPPAPYFNHLFFIHAPTSSSISSLEQMVSSDAYSLKAPFPSSRVFHRYEPASANDPPPSGLCNTRLDSHGKLKRHETARATWPQHPVKSGIKPIIDSLACFSDKQARHLSEKDPLDDVRHRGFKAEGGPGTNQFQGGQNAQVYANWHFY
jgi:hypothetical protein